MSRIVLLEGCHAACSARILARLADTFRDAVKPGGASCQAGPHHCGAMLDRLERRPIKPCGLRAQDGNLRRCLATEVFRQSVGFGGHALELVQTVAPDPRAYRSPHKLALLRPQAAQLAGQGGALAPRALLANRAKQPMAGDAPAESQD